MKAVVLTDDDELLLEDFEEPAPGAGEVAIKVAYAGVQWGDVLVRDGHLPIPRPFMPGFEAAGQITAVGEGVDPGRIGERVVALTQSGAFAEVALAAGALSLATDLDPRTAAASGWSTPTAYALVNTVAGVQPGESVLIHAAAGSLGTMAAQFAAAAGAGRIVGITSRIDYARQFGYHELIARDQFPEALGDDRFDVILDPVGGATRLASLELLAPHGRLAVYGNIETFEPVAPSVNDLLMNGQSLLTYNSNLLSRTDPKRLSASMKSALEMVADGKVRIDVGTEYALGDVGAAIGDLARGAGSGGKSVIRVDQVSP